MAVTMTARLARRIAREALRLALLAALVLAAVPVHDGTSRAEAAGPEAQDALARPEVAADGRSGMSGTRAGWLWLPEPAPTRYAGDIRQAAERHGVSPALVEAVIRVESAFNPFAISQKGARGLMQLMPGTAQALGVRDSFNPRQNIEGGVRHLRSLIDRYPGDLPRVLAAYNAGAGAVDFYGGIPPFPETRQYIQKVLQHQGITARVAIAAPGSEEPGSAAQPESSGPGEGGGSIARRLALGQGQPLPAVPLIEHARQRARPLVAAVAAPASARAGATEARDAAGAESITHMLARMREQGLLGQSAEKPGGASPDRR